MYTHINTLHKDSLNNFLKLPIKSEEDAKIDNLLTYFCEYHNTSSTLHTCKKGNQVNPLTVTFILDFASVNSALSPSVRTVRASLLAFRMLSRAPPGEGGSLELNTTFNYKKLELKSDIIRRYISEEFHLYHTLPS